MGYGPDAFGDPVQAFMTPNDVETFFYNSFRVPFSGYVVEGGWHVHGNAHDLRACFLCVASSGQGHPIAATHGVARTPSSAYLPRTHPGFSIAFA